MKNILRTIALAMIICFGPTCAFSADNVIKTKIILTPESPIFYENYIGIETPTKGQTFKLHVETNYNDAKVTNVKITSPGEFSIIKGPELEYENDAPKGNVFTLQAPEKEGKYTVVFEGVNSQGNVFSFDTQIKVVESDAFQNWVRAGLFIGIALVATVIVVIASNSGK